VRIFNIVKSRELLVARLRKEASYLAADVFAFRRQKVRPFVVVCRQRTGSNMLRYALETHPQVVHYGELFHESRTEIPGAHGRYLYRPQALLAWRLSDARSFLNEVVYRDTARPVQAVGFKLFYHHGREDGTGDPWPTLCERRDVKVIHLVRNNPLASFLSNERIQHHEPHIQMRAFPPARDARSSTRGERLVIDIAKFEAYLARYEHDIRQMQRDLAGHDQLELSYEALTETPGTTLTAVLDFLGVERRDLRFQTARQSRGELTHKIANLSDVESVLRGTRWERLQQAS
jgi:LPS sulfotransferase NodH